MTQFAKRKSVYAKSHSRQKELQNSVVNNLIVSGNLPINIVEQAWFKNFMETVDEKFVVPGRRTTVSMINTQYKAKKEMLCKKLLSADAVSLTMDMWSDRRMRSFMGATVHFLTEDMHVETYLLDMASFTGTHTGERIGNFCVSMVEEFGIRDILAFIVTDNAANMIKAFKSMDDLFCNLPVDEDDDDDLANLTTDMRESSSEGEEESETDGVELSGHQYGDDEVQLDGEEPLSDDIMEQVLGNLCNVGKMRLSCGIHTLQLVVIDGLKGVKFLTAILSKTCKLATLIHTSGVFSEDFFAVFKTTIPSTTNTRWNSVYIQLEAVSKLDASKLQTFLMQKKRQVCMLTVREMAILVEVVAILEPAYTATMIMEEEEALVSLVAPTVTALQKKWSTMSDSDSDSIVHCQSLARALLNSLEMRFKALFQNLKPLPEDTIKANEKVTSYPFSGPFGDLIYPVAASLDPDCRLEWLNDWQTDHDENVKQRVAG
jgi:hypothetical protein